MTHIETVFLIWTGAGAVLLFLAGLLALVIGVFDL